MARRAIIETDSAKLATTQADFGKDASGNVRVKTASGFQQVATAESVAAGIAIPNWEANTSYAANFPVRATATGTDAAGQSIDIGDLLRRETAGTSRASFDATEAALWRNLGADLVRSVAGKSGAVTLAKADVGLSNVPNTDATNPANITQSASYRFVTDTEKTTWNGKAAGTHTHAQSDVTNLATDLAAKEATANKNALSGYAGLDASGKLSASQMPMSVITGISRAMPDNIIAAANLGIYLLADDLATGAISAWDNKAGTTDFAQATSANQPIVEAVSALGNRLAAKFDGSDDWMETSANISLGTNYGLMAVIVPNSTINGEHPVLSEVFGGSTVEYVYGISGSQFRVGHYNGGWREYKTGTPVNGTAYILIVGYDGSNFHIKLDGGTDSTSAQTSNPTLTEANNIRLGRRWDGATASNVFHGHIAAVVAKKGAYFTAAEIENLEGWAAWYYNLVSKLPAGHKYKNLLPIYSV